MKHWYLCSLGSNVAPQQHLARALVGLLEFAPRLYTSRIIETQPEAMASQRAFLNAIVCFQSDWAPEQLKAALNAMEMASGRDRDHPDSSRRDRSLDIDILAVDHWQLRQLLADTPYLQTLACDFEPSSEPASGHSVALPGGVSAGQRAAAIDRHPTTGDIRVIEQVIDGLANRLQTAFHA